MTKEWGERVDLSLFCSQKTSELLEKLMSKFPTLKNTQNTVFHKKINQNSESSKKVV